MPNFMDEHPAAEVVAVITGGKGLLLLEQLTAAFPYSNVRMWSWPQSFSSYKPEISLKK